MRFVASSLCLLRQRSSAVGLGARDSDSTTDLSAIEIDGLLRRLARSTAAKRSQDRSFCIRGLEPRFLTIAFLAFFICMSSDAATTTFSITTQDAEVPAALTAQAVIEQAVGNTDRLPASETVDETLPAIRDEARLAESGTLREADFLEPLTFRGSIEDNSFAMPPRDLPRLQKLKSKRGASRAKSLTLQAENKLPEPPLPSFFEDLFGVRLPSS